MLNASKLSQNKYFSDFPDGPSKMIQLKCGKTGDDTDQTPTALFSSKDSKRMGSIVHIQQKYQQKQGDGRQRWPLVDNSQVTMA